MRAGGRVWIAIIGATVVVLGAAVAWALLQNVPVEYTKPEDRYAFGSFGTEVDSFPLPVWEALPEICPDKLPGGYASLGLIYADGQPRPIGISQRHVGGVDRMGVNCALCHTGAVREAPGAPPRIVHGMPNHQLDFQKYVQFQLACVADPRFTSENVVSAMRRRGPVSALDATIYRYIVVPTVKRRTAEKGQTFAWMAGRPPSGPGRLDTPNSLKQMLGLPIPGNSVGTVEFPSVWNQAPRLQRFVHWDANSPSLTERDHITAAIAGATTASLVTDELLWIEGWLEKLPPPAYPFAIDREKAARGAALYEAQCASCHVKLALDVTSNALVATDQSRLDALNPELVSRMNSFGGRTGSSAHYRKTDGYSNVLLDGIWARAPYLHNGSVPTMFDLLEAPERRPKVFYTGSAVYDQAKMGFISTEGEGTFRFDTSLPGNGNGGHDYGTLLSPEEKRELIEYLKTR